MMSMSASGRLVASSTSLFTHISYIHAHGAHCELYTSNLVFRPRARIVCGTDFPSHKNLSRLATVRAPPGLFSGPQDYAKWCDWLASKGR
jgi:hypothetical protein